MMLDSSTLTPLLKKMEKKGLITRNKSSLDERNLELKITKKGLSLEKNLQDIRIKFKDQMKMDEKEIKDLHRLTHKILNKIQEDMQ